MRELVWLDSAVEDLVRLRHFIAQENPEAAQRVAKMLQEASQQLRDFPHLGKPVPELPFYRDLLIRFRAGGYVLRYRVHMETIYIIHLRHYRETDFEA